MTPGNQHEEEAVEPDAVAMRIAEDERRRTGAFLRDYLDRHRIENLPAEPEEAGTDAGT